MHRSHRRVFRTAGRAIGHKYRAHKSTIRFLMRRRSSEAVERRHEPASRTVSLCKLGAIRAARE
jgi:hypothetical protein